MKVRLDTRKDALGNAAAYFELAKELSRKAQGAREAAEKTESELEVAKRGLAAASAEASQPPKMRRAREWYEKFRWFFASGGRLAIAGRDAKQNDLLFSRHMEEEDLFFHADIQGAPATILKGGLKAGQQEKEEAAQFAASHSSAWKVGASVVDVYAVRKHQLSKHAKGGYVGSGGFAIAGGREWFRGVALGLAMGAKEGVAITLPLRHPEAASLPFEISPGNQEKGRAAQFIAKTLGASVDEVLSSLPSGKFSLRKK